MGSIVPLDSMPEDFTPQDKEALASYIDNGVPGLSSISESDMAQWFIMYMAGKTVTEISVACKVDKEKVLFVAHKSKWLDKKMNHMNDIASNIESKVRSVKLESANTMATIISSFNKYYNDQFTKFLKTGDRTILEGVDTKLLGQYQKAIESLEKIISPKTKGDEDGGSTNPLVNINLGSGTMKQNPDGSIEFGENPNPDKLGEILKLMAEAKKQEQSDD